MVDLRALIVNGGYRMQHRVIASSLAEQTPPTELGDG